MKENGLAEKNRIFYIDAVKGWGILCIVVAHVTQYFECYRPLNGFLCAFHVPIFFVLVGIKDRVIEKNKLELKKRTKELLVPYVIFSLINSAIKLGILYLKHEMTRQVFANEMKELLFTGNGTVWFLATLWFLTLVSFGLRKIFYNSIWYMIIGSVLFVVLKLAPIPYVTGTVQLYRLIGALAYWCVGYTVFSLIRRMNHMVLGIGMILTGVGIIMFSVFQTGVDFFRGTIINGISSVIISILLSVGFICIFIWMDQRNRNGAIRKILGYFGRNSLIVMLLHPLFLQCIMFPFRDRLCRYTDWRSILIGGMVCVIIIVLEIPSIHLINRYFPFLIGKQKECRTEVS